MLRKQVAVRGIYDAMQKNLETLVTKVRTEIDDLNGSATFDGHAFRWDEKAGLRRDAVRSQVIDVLEAQEIKETGNEEG